MATTISPSRGRARATATRPCALVVGTGAEVAAMPERGIGVVELPVQIGDLHLPAQPADDEMAAFYERLRAGETPTTSTPSPGAYVEAFRACDSERIVCLTIPARWSATDETARLAARMLAEEEGEERVTVLDTGTAAAGLSLVARLAGRLCAMRCPAEDVIERAQLAAREVRMVGALETLEHVARSGRVNGLLAGLSDTLHIRPVFRLEAGETGRVALARTRSGVINALEKTAVETAEAVAPRGLEVTVFHADAVDAAAQLHERLTALPAVRRSHVTALAPLIGTHTGPGAIGYAAVPLLDDDPEPPGADL